MGVPHTAQHRVAYEQSRREGESRKRKRAGATTKMDWKGEKKIVKMSVIRKSRKIWTHLKDFNQTKRM